MKAMAAIVRMPGAWSLEEVELLIRFYPFAEIGAVAAAAAAGDVVKAVMLMN